MYILLILIQVILQPYQQRSDALVDFSSKSIKTIGYQDFPSNVFCFLYHQFRYILWFQNKLNQTEVFW